MYAFCAVKLLQSNDRYSHYDLQMSKYSPYKYVATVNPRTTTTFTLDLPDGSSYTFSGGPSVFV